MGLAVKVGTEVTVGLTAGFLVAVAVGSTGEVGAAAEVCVGATLVTPGCAVCVGAAFVIVGCARVGGTVVAVG